MKRLFLFKIEIMCALMAVLFISACASAAPWKFGVMADTQWTCATDPASANPNKVAVSIANQINQQFINHGVRFVIQVGDLTENGNNADIAIRAAAAQALYNAGIGFFPMRGNHEVYASPANGFGIPAMQSNFQQTQCLGPYVFGATNCNSPTLAGDYPNDLLGMSYSFDYGDAGNNARFVILDVWRTPNKYTAIGSSSSYPFGYTVADQQSWIGSRLDKTTRGTAHAFVFGHQNLIGENHTDSLFQVNTYDNAPMQNAFFACLQANDAGSYISGHDHIHQRSIIKSPDNASAVRQLVCTSDSSKFYTPKSTTDSAWGGQKVRETSVSQELYTVGYYVYTVDGPRVTVDFYSDDHGGWASDNSYPGSGYPNQVTPTFNFVKKETWGWSLNGKEIQVAQGGSYMLSDNTSKATANGETGYFGTTAKILSGTNNSTKKDYSNRALTKAVGTGWAPRIAGTTLSDVFTLWGMTDLGAGTTDTFVLSVSYDPATVMTAAINAGHPAYLAKKDAGGSWTKAASGRFVLGPYNAKYPLGFYGLDMQTKTAWAVVSQTGEFAVIQP